MASEPICTHCGEPLGEDIPKAIEDPIRIRCPNCELVYVFHRTERGATAEEEQYYFSSGFFRKNPVQMDARNPETSVMNRTCLLCFCVVGPLILFGIISLVYAFLNLLGWLGP
ncbi:MAG: hypothetical protein ACTSSE_10930 [Candidatus Thorarchaeota archaeon]